MESAGRALEHGAKLGTAAVTKISKTTLSAIPDVINFYHAVKGLYLGKILYTF